MQAPDEYTWIVQLVLLLQRVIFIKKKLFGRRNVAVKGLIRYLGSW